MKSLFEILFPAPHVMNDDGQMAYAGQIINFGSLYPYEDKYKIEEFSEDGDKVTITRVKHGSTATYKVSALRTDWIHSK